MPPKKTTAKKKRTTRKPIGYIVARGYSMSSADGWFFTDIESAEAKTAKLNDGYGYPEDNDIYVYMVKPDGSIQCVNTVAKGITIKLPSGWKA